MRSYLLLKERQVKKKTGLGDCEDGTAKSWQPMGELTDKNIQFWHRSSYFISLSEWLITDTADLRRLRELRSSLCIVRRCLGHRYHARRATISDLIRLFAATGSVYIKLFFLRALSCFRNKYRKYPRI